jgi:hypothetical protein
MSKISHKLLKLYGGGVFAFGFYRGYNNQYSESSLLQHRDSEYRLIKNGNIYNFPSQGRSPENSGSSPLLPDEKMKCTVLKSTLLVSDKIIYGMYSGFYYINPIYHIVILFHATRRMEKRLRNIPLNEHDWRW